MSIAPEPIIADAAPTEAQLTEYDRAHLGAYLRLLDAAAEHAPWEEVAAIVLGIQPSTESDRVRRAHDTHLARARWMTEQGYRELLRSA